MKQKQLGALLRDEVDPSIRKFIENFRTSFQKSMDKTKRLSYDEEFDISETFQKPTQMEELSDSSVFIKSSMIEQRQVPTFSLDARKLLVEEVNLFQNRINSNSQTERKYGNIDTFRCEKQLSSPTNEINVTFSMEQLTQIIYERVLEQFKEKTNKQKANLQICNSVVQLSINNCLTSREDSFDKSIRNNLIRKNRKSDHIDLASSQMSQDSQFYKNYYRTIPTRDSQESDFRSFEQRQKTKLTNVQSQDSILKFTTDLSKYKQQPKAQSNAHLRLYMDAENRKDRKAMTELTKQKAQLTNRQKINSLQKMRIPQDILNTILNV
ncbi:hypothetical protein pb186bvf_011016 [Paramecium bursaria]